MNIKKRMRDEKGKSGTLILKKSINYQKISNIKFNEIYLGAKNMNMMLSIQKEKEDNYKI